MKTLRLRKQKSIPGHGPHHTTLSRLRYVWAYSLLCALALGGCTKDAEPGNEQEMSNVAILMQGSVGNGIDVEVEDRNGSPSANQTHTRAPIDGGTATTAALSLSVVRADETSRLGGVYGNYSATAISATRTAATGSTPTALVLDPVQYYPANERNTRFTGWHPQVGTGVTYSAGVVTFTFDGNQDIMTAPAAQGNLTDVTQLNLAFTHRLSQVRVWVYAADALAQTAWGNVKGVKILTQRTGCTYTPASNATTGNVAFTGDPSTALTVYNNPTGVTPGVGQAAAVQAGDNVMIEPQGASYVLTLEIAATGAGTVPMQVSLNAQAFEASKAYNIYLKLTIKDILPTATISDWGAPTDSDVQL